MTWITWICFPAVLSVWGSALFSWPRSCLILDGAEVGTLQMKDVQPLSALSLPISTGIPCLLLGSNERAPLAQWLPSWCYSASPKHGERCLLWFPLSEPLGLLCRELLPCSACIRGWFYLEMTDLYLYIIRKALSVFTQWQARINSHAITQHADLGS